MWFIIPNAVYLLTFQEKDSAKEEMEQELKEEKLRREKQIKMMEDLKEKEKQMKEELQKKQVKYTDYFVDSQELPP
jgi:predicted Holliday junction resolvase-like endonuclease